MLASCDVEEGDNGFNNATFTIQVPTSDKLHLVDPYSDGRYEVDSPIDADTPITLTVTITDDKDTVLCSEKVHAFPGDTLTLSRVLTDIPAGTICTVPVQILTPALGSFSSIFHIKKQKNRTCILRVMQLGCWWTSLFCPKQ